MRRIEKYYTQGSKRIREQLSEEFTVYKVAKYETKVNNAQKCIREFFLELSFCDSDLNEIQVCWNVDGTFSIDQDVLPYLFWEKEKVLKCIEYFLASPFKISIRPLIQVTGPPGYSVSISKEYISSIAEVIEILKELKIIIIKLHDELALLDNQQN